MNKKKTIDKFVKLFESALEEALQEFADEPANVLPPEVAEFWEVTTERSEWMWFGPENTDEQGQCVLRRGKEYFNRDYKWWHEPEADQHCVRLKQKYRDEIERTKKYKIDVVDWRKPVKGVEESWITPYGSLRIDSTGAPEDIGPRPILKITPIDRQWETVEYLHGNPKYGIGIGPNLTTAELAAKCGIYARRLVHPNGTVMVIEPGQVVEVQDEKEGE